MLQNKKKCNQKMMVSLKFRVKQVLRANFYAGSRMVMVHPSPSLSAADTVPPIR